MFLLTKDPDVLLQGQFIEDILNPYMYSLVMESGNGIKFLIFSPYGWSNNSDTLKVNDKSFGSSVSQYLADSSNAVVSPGMKHVMMWRTDGPLLDVPWIKGLPLLRLGSVNSQAQLIWEGPCRLYPNYTAGQIKGRCMYPKGRILEIALGLFHDILLQNANTTDGYLVPKNTVHLGNIESSGSHLAIKSGLSYDHPSMPNKYPRQDHRVGLISSSQNAAIFTEVLTEADLPDDSHLYIVERHWQTGEEGVIIATSYGNPWIKVPTIVNNQAAFSAFPIHVSQHNDSEGRPSVIREHGVYMLSPDSIGYEESTKLPVDVPHPWTSSNGTQYWSQVKKITAGSNLVWYITLLVSRDVVMKTIDEATDTIRINIDSDRSKADDDKKQSFTIMLVAVLVSAILLLGVGVMFTKVIISPLLVLQRDMECVAQMKLDKVDGSRPVSSLSEVRAMELSFRQMIKNLIEYRNYMPQSVLIDADESEEVSAEGTILSESGAKTSRSGISTSQSSCSRVAAQNQMLTDTTLKKKNISVVTFNVIEFHKLIHGKSDGKVHELHQKVLTTITTRVASLKGVCDTFSGDQVLATFNAVRPASGYALASAQAGKGAAQELKEVVQLSFACGSGDGKVGNMGIKGMKKFSILSTSVPFVVELEKLNRKYGLSGLIDHYQNGPVSVGTTLTKVFSITCPKRDAKPITAFEIVGLREVVEEEWMYQLENAAEGNKSPWNETFEAIMTGDWDAAGKSFENCDKQHPLYSLMKEGITTSKKDPLCYSM